MSDGGWITVRRGYGVDEETLTLRARDVTAIIERYSTTMGWETFVTCAGIIYRVKERAEDIKAHIAKGAP